MIPKMLDSLVITFDLTKYLKAIKVPCSSQNGIIWLMVYLEHADLICCKILWFFLCIIHFYAIFISFNFLLNPFAHFNEWIPFAFILFLIFFLSKNRDNSHKYLLKYQHFTMYSFYCTINPFLLLMPFQR